jgi:hypothetical protein
METKALSVATQSWHGLWLLRAALTMIGVGSSAAASCSVSQAGSSA